MPRFSTLKKRRPEEDFESTKKKRSGRSRVEKVLVAVKTQSTPASPARSEQQHSQGNARSLIPPLSRAPFFSFPSPTLCRIKRKKRKGLSAKGGGAVCWTDLLLTWDLSSRSKSLFRPLFVPFKCTSVDDKSTEAPTPQFSKCPGVITLIINTDGNLKIWDH